MSIEIALGLDSVEALRQLREATAATQVKSAAVETIGVNPPSQINPLNPTAYRLPSTSLNPNSQRQGSQIESSRASTGAVRDAAWGQVGATAINTQNTTADSDSTKLGRDNLRAEDHMLDGQLDNKDNTFLEFTGSDDKQYLVFRSRSDIHGNYYGYKELSSNNDWKTLAEGLPANVSSELKASLDKVHEIKQANIAKHGGWDNYKAAQGMRGEIKDLLDLYGTEKGTHVTKDSSRGQGLEKIASIYSDLERISSGDKAVAVNELKAQFDQIKKSHPEIASDMLKARLDKASSLIGENDLASIKAGLEGKETDLALINKANEAIDQKISEARNAGQKLGDNELVEYKKLDSSVDDLMKALDSKYASDPAFQKIKSHYEKNSGFEANASELGKGKYSLAQLKAFKEYLDKNSWTQKARDITKQSADGVHAKVIGANLSDVKEKAFSTPAEFQNYLRDMPLGERVNVTNPKVRGYYSKDQDGNIYTDAGNNIAYRMKDEGQGFVSDKSQLYALKRDGDQLSAYAVEQYSPEGRVPVYLNRDSNGEIVKVFKFTQSKVYEEAEKKTIAGVTAFKVLDTESYYAANKEKKDNPDLSLFWKVNMANPDLAGARSTAGNVGPTSDSHGRSLIFDINGLAFYYHQSGYMIGLSADASRESGLSYNEQEYQEALRRFSELQAIK